MSSSRPREDQRASSHGDVACFRASERRQLSSIVAGFAAVFSRVAHTSVPQHKPLVWQAGVFPPGTRVDPDNFIPDVAVSDGAKAYLCILPQPSEAKTDLRAQIWVSENRAMSWTHTAYLPTAGLTGANLITSCWVTVDDANPDIAVANAEPSDSLTATITDSSFITFDGGRTWQPLNGHENNVATDLSTWHNSMYICCSATTGMLAGTVDRRHRTLMATHHSADTGCPSTAEHFYVKPDSGELLALAEKDGVSHMWVSKEGARWTPIPAPAVPGYLAGYIVQQPIAGHPWDVCAESFPPNTLATSLSGLTCTTDSGQSWQQLPVAPGIEKNDSTSVLAITSAGNIWRRIFCLPKRSKYSPSRWGVQSGSLWDFASRFTIPSTCRLQRVAYSGPFSRLALRSVPECIPLRFHRKRKSIPNIQAQYVAN